MHKLLEIQLKKSFGAAWQEKTNTPEFEQCIAFINQSYQQFDDDYKMIEHVLDVNSKELTEANNSIKESHELLRSVTESVKELIFYKDLEFKYIGCNQSFADFFGRKREEFIGHDDFDIYTQKYASLFREMDTKMFTSMLPQTNEEWVQNSQGEDILLLTTKAPLLDSTGEIFGLVGISRDITKEYSLEKELKVQQALLIQQSRNAAMGEMISNIAHQWRQPLNALSLLLQNVIFAYETKQLGDAHIERMKDKGNLLISTMSNTIDDFRNFFKPNKTKEIFDITTECSKTLKILHASFENHHIIETVQMQENLLVYGFPNEFSQVLMNIFSNAKDAIISKKISKPSIEIRGYHKEKKIILEIEDNAGGIDNNVISKIFDPYFTTKEEGKGSGIGLYMSKMIVENNMHGQLIVENKNQGAMFTITLAAKENK